MTDAELIHRLNRAQGQIEAIKKSIQNESEKDCVRTIRLVKAANNALKKFAEAYVSRHMEQCMAESVPRKEMEQGLKETLSSAFSL
jgi:DNA-binding FrmR family transcriptional regulator